MLLISQINSGMGIKATLIDNEAIKFVFLQFSNGPFTPPAIGGHKYFITFIDDHSYYGFVELIREKFYSFETFKSFKAKVELQQRKNIKVVHSNICGEYYCRYDEMGPNPGPFAKYLQECDIDSQYTMFSTPQQNEIEERRNRTLLDIVRCILINS